MRNYFSWTPDELEFLRNNYHRMTAKQLSAYLRGRNHAAILKKAQKLGLSKGPQRKAAAEILLQDNPVVYYWIGFLLADGHFSERRITLKIADADKDHLLMFARYIGSTNHIRCKHNCHMLRFTNVNVVQALRLKFGIHSNKTKHPAKLGEFASDLLFSLIIGYIDGDGSVTRNKTCDAYRLSVVGDKSWLRNFRLMESTLYAAANTVHLLSSSIRVNNVKLPQETHKRRFSLSHFYICKKHVLQAIRIKADRLELPYLQRKLGRIPLPVTRS